MSRGIALTPAEKRKIRWAYRAGVPISEIRNRFDISKSTVYNVVKTHRGRVNSKVTQGVLNDIARLNYRGYSDNAIARKLGLAQDTVWKHRTALGLPVVPRQNRVKDR